MPENLLDAKEAALPDLKDSIYILTNEEKRWGASAILCTWIRERIGELFPEGVYILPSSIHETMIASKQGRLSPKELTHMLREVNRTVVGKEDFLSNRIYEYDRTVGKISRVPETADRKRGMDR